MSDEQDVITGIKAPVYLKYNFTAGAAPARFLAQIKKGVLTGQRCPKCSAVYAPPRGSCEEVHIGQRVQAVWKPESEWDYSMDNIRYFKPIDEPNVPFEKIGTLTASGWEG